MCQPALSLGDSLSVSALQLSGCLSKPSSFAFHCRFGGGKKREDTERHKTKPSSNSQCNAVEVGHIAPFLFIFFFSLSISAIITVIDSEKCKLICSSRAFYCVSPFLCVLTFQILEGCGVCIAILIPIILACCLLLNWVLDRVSTCTH